MNIHASIPCAKVCGKPQPKQATNGCVYYTFRFEVNQTKYDAQIFEDSPTYEKFEKMHLKLNDYVNMQAIFKTKSKVVKKEVDINGDKVSVEVPTKLNYFSILDIDFSIPKEYATNGKKEPKAKTSDVAPITDLSGFYEGGD